MWIAREQGATMMGLNATPEGLPLYRGLDFHELGTGLTWLLPARRSRTVPDPGMVAIAEAIGRGQPVDLEEAALATRLPNGDLPIQFAARFGRDEMVRWLLSHGAEPDIVAMWDAGLHDDATRAMSSPDALNRPSGPWRATPLHHAVERNDVTLAELLVLAGADLTARDTQFRATALEWAEYFDRQDIAAIIRSAMRR
jgi:ankyrin repeat protein